MANMHKFVVALLILTIVLSTVSVVFNLMIFKMSSDNTKILQKSSSSNAGNIGLYVEENNAPGGNGG